MTLMELYYQKLEQYRQTGLREKPEELLAMILLSEKDYYESLRVNNGKFYEKYKTAINSKIAQVENDFKFTKEDMIKIMKEQIYCDNYDEEDKVWLVFGKGIDILHRGIIYHKDKTPEEIFSLYFEDMEVKEEVSSTNDREKEVALDKEILESLIKQDKKGKIKVKK